MSRRKERRSSWSNLKALAAAAALLGLGGWFVADKFVLPWLDRGNRVLYAAIESGDVGRVQAVLDAGADPNSRDAGHSASDEEWREYFPDRPLLAALRKKDFAVATLLIQRGAQVNPDRSSPRSRARSRVRISKRFSSCSTTERR